MFTIVDKKLGYDIYSSKEELKKSFFGEFYKFILEYYGDTDFRKYNINNIDDFVKATDFNWDNKDNCYGMGFAFHKYFLDANGINDIEKQDTMHFIGYCYKNDLFRDFINFLITFFAWWRNDEGCTTFNPYNHADEFFSSSWASLVDTCKLFYYTSETVYHWQSFRVKYALDNIPGVILINNDEKVRVCGYESIYEGNNVKLVRKDFYNYWEKEEKTIDKVYVTDYKKADPE